MSETFSRFWNEKLRADDEGIEYIEIIPFLLDENSLE